MKTVSLFTTTAFGLLAAAIFCAPVVGQDEKPKLNLIQDLLLPGVEPGVSSSENHIRLAGSITVQKGSRRSTLSLTANIDPGWHVYSVSQKPGGPMPSKIKVAESADFKLLGPFQPDQQPHIKPPDVFPVPSEEHEGKVVWSAPIELAEGVNAEKLTISLTYDGQVCSKVCIPLTEKVAATFGGYTEAPAGLGEYHPAQSQAQLVLKGHIEPAALAPGGKAKLVLSALPNPGWHVYAYAPLDPDVVGGNKPTLIHVVPPSGWSRSPVKASSAPKVKPPLAAGLPEERFHDEPVTWTIELGAGADSPTGEAVVSGYIGLQTCKEGCLPPQAVQFRANIRVGSKSEAGTVPLEFIALKRSDEGTPATVGSYNDVARLVAANPVPTGKLDWRTLLPAVGFGLLGGLILNLMPCVLPVIGLKLLSFAQQGGQSRARIFALNVWFALGLLLVFIVLATLAAFGSLIPLLNENLSWGQQFTFTGFKVAMVVIVFAFALSFLGVWEIPIPGFAQSNASSKLQQQEGASGTFFKGVFTTVLATPCSGPFLGPVFAYTLAQPPLATYLIFTSVGVGMASPYLVIGAFPALVRWLPKPGVWMETLKQLMGFVLLGTVVYLFATINADYFIPTLALVVGVWFACWVIGRVPIYESASKQVRAWVGGCAAAAAVGWFSFAYLGPQKHLYEWKTYAPEAIAKLQSEGKTVMVDFTADWCATCQWNFLFAINTQRVKAVVEKNGVVPMLADWSDRNETIKQKLEELNSNSIPVMAIYPAGKPGDVIILRDTLVEGQVIAALEEAGPSKTGTVDGRKPKGATVVASQPSS